MENIALITADDFSAYSIHEEFCPNIYRFAEENFNFKNAHCNITFCQPSRSVLMTGLYPQNNGSTEFCPIKDGVLTLPKILQDHGYYTALIGKNNHHKPYSVYKWDFEFAPNNRRQYLQSVLDNLKSVIQHKPFFVVINLKYPHRPFVKGHRKNVPIPIFLRNNPTIKEDLVNYYASVTELDYAFTKIMNILECRVIFTSDHGMSFPFVKGNCYHYSTNIPLIYSGIKQTDYSHMISHVDFTPTILNLLGITGYKFDGQSYYKLLIGEEENTSSFVYAQMNRMLAGPPIRIRSIISERYSYVFNIDRHYPADFVDGWEWSKLLQSYTHPRLYNRNREELINLSNNKDVSKTDSRLKLRMRNTLIIMMKKYNDPLLNHLRSFLMME